MRMKKNIVFAFMVLLVAFASCSFTSNSFENNDKDKLLLELIGFVLEKWHFSPETIDDTFSEKVYNDFINDLDPMKRVFLAADIQEFSKFRYQIDDEIKNVDIEFFNVVYERYMTRLKETQSIYEKVLERPFDFNKVDSVQVDYLELTVLSNRAELEERWRKQLKFNVLGSYYDKWEREQDKVKEDAAYVPKDNETLEIEAREQTLSTLDDNYTFYFNDLERKDWFVQYLNSIVETYDPHTFYFAPEDKERFDIGMSGKFEGIGARLSKQRDHTRIVEIISGGPVWRAQNLEVGDEILKVGQEDEEIPVDIVGMRLDDAIKLIKGPKGTMVRLWIKKVDGTQETIEVVRDVVELEETYAKSATVQKGNLNYGIINLPKFYVDFDDYDKRNAASDIAVEIDRLKEAGVQGLVLDLRDNGGGSLQTVVDIAGLFIKKGPVVQVKSSQNQVDVFEDTDANILWDGPLVILVNELSASASEILAAAMQDYKRAIIIGSKQTFGKGTVQNIIPFNRIVRNSDFGDLGALKITTQKFYRVNGGATQLKGVSSDVVVPDRYSYMEIGERDQEFPLPWDEIAAANYDPWTGYIDYENTIERSKNRMASNSQLKLIDENARWIQERQKRKLQSLKFDDYQTEIKADEERIDYFNKIREYDSKLTFKSLQYENELFTQDSILREKRDRWHRALAKDVYVEEALNVLEDLNLKFINPTRMIGIKN